MLSSLKELFKIGPGPSSSHTIGPHNAAKDFKSLIQDLDVNVHVTLFGSLALTGHGHRSDFIIKNILPNATIDFDINTKVDHPNTMLFEASKDDKVILKKYYLSVGGGSIAEGLDGKCEEKLIYPFNNFSEIRSYLEKTSLSYIDFILKYEDPDIIEYLKDILVAMDNEVANGLKAEGEVAGKLHVKRIAKQLYSEAKKCKNKSDKKDLLISAYAYAVAEENSGNGFVVTAPTCGSAGVLPAVLYYLKHDLGFKEKQLIDGLIVAGLLGLVIKANATISGAVGGCQAEIGSATAMASGALCAAENLSLAHIEYAAENGLEHQLGLTCDPVEGYVAIPCIERNAHSALKAYDAYLYAKFLKAHRENAVSFDTVVEVMKETGEMMHSALKETSIGGLAKSLHSRLIKK